MAQPLCAWAAMPSTGRCDVMERHGDTVGQAEAAAKTMGRNHRRVGAYAASGALAMLLLAFASVPLYRLFCQVTGFAGTTQKASQPSSVVLDRTITIRFDATVNPALDWMVTTQTIRFGETALAY
jgi:cytochrome c oxidase assembly protein subunit 11